MLCIDDGSTNLLFFCTRIKSRSFLDPSLVAIFMARADIETLRNGSLSIGQAIVRSR